MAKETSGGRVGRTVYLSPDLWAQLEALARGKAAHPAFHSREIRSGSVSGVIEKILTWDAAAKLQSMERQVKARELKHKAGQVATQLEKQLASVVATLIELRDSDV